jgi:hypothetical protein
LPHRWRRLSFNYFVSLQQFNQPLSRKAALRTVGWVLLILALGVGARFAWVRYKARPLSVAQTRASIRAYLERQSGIGRFSPLQLPDTSTNSPAAGDPADSTKADKKKKRKLRSPAEEIARDFSRHVSEANDYKSIYRLIGENLAGVDQLLAAHDPEQTKSALVLAVEATRAALDPAKNGWLAARIAEGYLWPNLDDAPTSDKNALDPAGLLDLSEEAFKAADEMDNLIRNYRLLIVRSARPAKADKLRVHLAKLLEDAERFPDALRVLHEVNETNSTAFVRRLTSVETKLQQQKKYR